MKQQRPFFLLSLAATILFICLLWPTSVTADISNAINRAILQAGSWIFTALQTFQGGIAQPSNFIFISPLTTPTQAPSVSTSSTSGTCTNANTYHMQVAWTDHTGSTGIGPASGDIVPSPSSRKITVSLNESIPSGATAWTVFWSKSSDGFATKRMCASGSVTNAANYQAVTSTTFDCTCSVAGAAYSGSTLAQVTAGSFSNGVISIPSLGTDPMQFWTPGTVVYNQHTAPPLPAVELHVCNSGCQYSTITAAMAAITDAAASKRYAVVVHPGEYIEAEPTIKSYVNLIGTDRAGVRILNGLLTATNGTEMGVFNLTTGMGQLGNVGSISGDTGSTVAGTLYIANCNIGVTDGSNSVGGDTTKALSAGKLLTIYSTGNLYRSKDTWGVSGYQDTTIYSRGDVIEFTQTGTGGYSALPRDEGGASVYMTGARIEMTMTAASGNAEILGCHSPDGAGTRSSTFRILASYLHLTSTNASFNGTLACLAMKSTDGAADCAGASNLGADYYLSGVVCDVSAADSASTIDGVLFGSSTNHANGGGWKAVWSGGRISLSGGATRRDVDNQETGTGTSVTLAYVDRSLGFNGSGNSYAVGSLPASACSSKCAVGQSCTNTTPALCLCTSSNTWTKVSGGGSCP